MHFEWRRGLFTGMQITADVIPTLPFAYHNEVSLNYTTQSRDAWSGMEDSGAALETSLSTLYVIPTASQGMLDIPLKTYFDASLLPNWKRRSFEE